MAEIYRVTLRPFALSDVDDFMAWATDEKVTRFCSWEPYKSRDEALKFIEEKAIPDPWHKVICVDDKAIGSISVNQGAGVSRCRGELGYVVGSKYWGKGVASQAVRLVLSTVFEDLSELERVEALVEPANLASQRVLEKVGFVREGLLSKYFTIKGSTRDFYIYRFLASDLIPQAAGHRPLGEERRLCLVVPLNLNKCLAASNQSWKSY